MGKPGKLFLKPNYTAFTKTNLGSIPSKVEKTLIKTEENIPITDLFDQFNLKLELLRAIYSYNLEKPSLIQKLTIKELLSKHDIIVKSKPGTGKTLS